MVLHIDNAIHFLHNRLQSIPGVDRNVLMQYNSTRHLPKYGLRRNSSMTALAVMLEPFLCNRSKANAYW